MKLCIYGSRGCKPTVAEIDATLGQASAGGWFLGHEVDTLICGMAQGADEAGYRWAKAKGLPIVERPADWSKHGKAAGHIRNAAMAAECDVALGFWDGTSGGTANMTAHLVALGKRVHLVKWSKK